MVHASISVFGFVLRLEFGRAATAMPIKDNDMLKRSKTGGAPFMDREEIDRRISAINSLPTLEQNEAMSDLALRICRQDSRTEMQFKNRWNRRARNLFHKIIG